jgi:hypothetical protein
MIYWKVENGRKKKKEKDKVRKQRFSGRFLPLFLCSVASCWSELDFLSDIHIKPEWFKQSLDWFKSTRGLICLGRRGYDLTFKWESLNCSVFSHTGNSSLNNLTQLQLQDKQLGIFPSFDKKAGLKGWGYICIGLGWWNRNISNHCNVWNSVKDWETIASSSF